MFTIITQGSFTSTGAAQIINLPSSANYFKTVNITQMATTQATGRCVMGEWYSGVFNANDGIRWKKTNSTSAMNADLFSTSTASDGFTYVTVAPTAEAYVSGFSSTQANPAVVTQTNTYSNGDIVRLKTATGDLVLGGMKFQISSVSGAGYTLLGLPATAANGYTAISAASTSRVSKYDAVEPEYLFITGIQTATTLTTPYSGAVVSVSVDPSNYYVAGMKVRFSIPNGFGMTQMNGLTGTITNVNVSNAGGANVAAYNFVVDIDVSSFNAFVFPASSTSPTQPLFATVAPAGAKTSYDPNTGVQLGYNFTLQPFHTGQFVPYMKLGGGAQSPAGSSGDVIVWQAFKQE